MQIDFENKVNEKIAKLLCTSLSNMEYSIAKKLAEKASNSNLRTFSIKFSNGEKFNVYVNGTKEHSGVGVAYMDVDGIKLNDTPFLRYHSGRNF